MCSDLIFWTRGGRFTSWIFCAQVHTSDSHSLADMLTWELGRWVAAKDQKGTSPGVGTKSSQPPEMTQKGWRSGTWATWCLRQVIFPILASHFDLESGMGDGEWLGVSELPANFAVLWRPMQVTSRCSCGSWAGFVRLPPLPAPCRATPLCFSLSLPNTWCPADLVLDIDLAVSAASVWATWEQDFLTTFIKP